MGTENRINASVGRNGRNINADVLVVQRLLKASLGRFGPIRPVTTTGVCGPETIDAITRFQRVAVKMPAPDGRVDPGGKTLTTLIQYSTGPQLAPPHPAPGAWDISQAGLKAIGVYEGLSLKLYNCAAGFATIGYGHLVHRGRVGTNSSAEAPWGKGITEIDALALLKKDAAIHVNAVRSAVRVPLIQHEFDALVSLSFNIGTGGFSSSTLVRIINKGGATPVEIKTAFCMWNKAAGKVNQGLMNRREKEAMVYSDGKY